MGADCCGGGPPPSSAESKDAAAAANGAAAVNEAAAGVGALSVDGGAPKSASAASASPSKKGEPAAPAKPHSEYVAEIQSFLAKRIELFEQYRKRDLDKVEAAKSANAPIKVTLPDGSQRDAVAGVTTPHDVALGISKSLAKDCVVAKVDGADWDLMRPLQSDCNLELFKFDSDEGKHAFWHSSAHVLGEALEQTFGVRLTIGPALAEGFYYDCFMGDGRSITETDFPVLDKAVSKVINEKQKFERAVVSRDEALGMFQENKFKVEIIEGLPDDAEITLYRCGPMVDLCSGPHLPNTGYLKAAKVTSSSSAYWRADAKREALQRVYGITFPEKAQLADYEHRVAEAKRRDHRVLATAQDLVLWHPLSPGSAFMMPAGARVYNELVEFMRELYWEHEFDEVVTPNLYNFELWNTSGHADHYKENMFCVEVEKQEFGLKPMNCPGHCLLFASRARSYRDLPLRMADFGVLHRNEYSGALSGLTRVRRFQQDDAHIFCRPDQVSQEVSMCLRMLDQAYSVFGLDYSIALSTRPESFMGDLAQWDAAEGALKAALDDAGRAWELNEGDGAFYGPKIDITVFDALRRKFQCATIQLDFQLPIRFRLSYATEESHGGGGGGGGGGASSSGGGSGGAGAAAQGTPVIVHRAILGSVERMFAILTEHYAGKWPLWLSPRQAMVVPISASSNEYAEEVRRELRRARFHAEADVMDKKMQKKVREAQLAQFNYILVVGEAEKEARTVNVRTRDNKVHGMHSLASVIDVMSRERKERSKGSLFDEFEEKEKEKKEGGKEEGGGEAKA